MGSGAYPTPGCMGGGGKDPAPAIFFFNSISVRNDSGSGPGGEINKEGKGMGVGEEKRVG